MANGGKIERLKGGMNKFVILDNNQMLVLKTLNLKYVKYIQIV